MCSSDLAIEEKNGELAELLTIRHVENAKASTMKKIEKKEKISDGKVH